MEHGLGFARLGWWLHHAGLPAHSKLRVGQWDLGEGLSLLGPRLEGTV